MKIRLSEGVACLGGALTSVLLLATTAHAAINISTQATQNMSCSGGVCTATAQKAYLNVIDVTNFLAAGDLKVVSGAGAEDIHIQAPFSWTSTSRLTLDAQRSIEFEKPVSVAGTGALTLVTNDGGTDGDYWFDEGASVTFWDTASSLIINGQSFTLVKDIKTLAADIAANPAGNFALASTYDASVDGTYSHAPVATTFNGYFDGLGNATSAMIINDITSGESVGFFAVSDGGTIANLRVRRAHVAASDYWAGVLLGTNENGAIVKRCSSTGSLSSYGAGGGLVGLNVGSSVITRSYSSARVSGESNLGIFGGLVGGSGSDTLISESFATGPVFARGAYTVGGLVGESDHEVIEDSYATGSVTLQKPPKGWRPPAEVGGLVGYLLDDTVTSSYSTGRPEKKNQPGGGFVGVNFDSKYKAAYWDIDTSDATEGCAKNKHTNLCPPLGLSDAQLKSALPDGFDPQVWGQDANINNGYPYLLSNPPPKNAPGKSAAKSVSPLAHRAPHI